MTKKHRENLFLAVSDTALVGLEGKNCEERCLHSDCQYSVCGSYRSGDVDYNGVSVC